MKIRVAAAAAAAAAVTIGCTAKIPPASLAVTPAESEVIWKAASSELQAQGFKVEAYEPVAGTMRTRTRVMPGTTPCGFLTCGYRDTIHVTVSPRGDVAVKIDRELASPGVVTTPTMVMAGTSWVSPSTAQRSTVAIIHDDQETLLRSILARAKGAPPAAAAPAAGAAPSSSAPGPSVDPAAATAPAPAAR